MATLRRTHLVWLMVPALLLFWWLALSSMVDDSPTMDEQNHLGRGLAMLRTGDPRLSLEHPPLTNTLSALPLLTMPEIELPTDSPSWDLQPPDIFWYLFSNELVWQRNRDLNLEQIFFLVRFPIVLMLLALGMVGFVFARLLWGRFSAVAALLFLLFDPNLLAHGRVTTTDLGGTLFITLATLALWWMWSRPRWEWTRVAISAVAMGLAFGSKLSALGFVPIWLLMALLPLTNGGWHGAPRRLGQTLLAGMGSIVVVWAIFNFEWGPLMLGDERLAAINGLRVPMPTFWGGIERILLISGGGRASFLLGEYSSEGFPLYFPIAWLIKTPIVVVVLSLVSAVGLVWLRATRRRALFLLLPALLYFAISTQSSLNIGYRHLLPMLPLVYLLMAGLGSSAVVSHQRWARGALAVGVVGVAISAVWIYPHFLSYFNWAIGGPNGGRDVLVDSNIDWGQDLFRLQDWMADNDVDRVKLAWFGTAEPDAYALSYDPLPGFPNQPFWGLWTQPPFNPAEPEPGIYAISVSNLWESQLADKWVYGWFREREPDDQIGYSILIYDLREGVSADE